MVTIYIHRTGNGWIRITDDQGNSWRYLYYSKREALRLVKEKFGYRYVRNVEVIEINY